MEDVLDVYSGDHDDGTVLVCVDETSKQQTKETREPLSVRPRQPAGYDFEYERNGVRPRFVGKFRKSCCQVIRDVYVFG